MTPTITSTPTETSTTVIRDPAVLKGGDPEVAKVGDIVVFTITVFNYGSTDALGVQIVDDLPNFLDIQTVTISPTNASQTITIVGSRVTVFLGTVPPTPPPNPPPAFTITITTIVNDLGQPPGGINNVTLTSTTPDSDLTNNQDDFYLRIIEPELPDTGFAPFQRTILPPQPASMLYTSYANLWLEIPALDVSMPIVGVPFTESGWDVAWLWNNVGYLYNTAFPTWPGNTGITGHVTLSTGLPGPFSNLGELRWGDEVIIHAWGLRHIYKVRVAKQVNPDDMSVLGHKEYDWVTLITCKYFNEYLNEYEARVVVQAVLMKVELDPK
jgi:LPXTG-site transpeptidase (sortase) family protein